MLCEQYAQSSGQAPVLIERSVLTCTSFGSKLARWTRCAWNSRSANGSANSWRTSSSGPVGADFAEACEQLIGGRALRLGHEMPRYSYACPRPVAAHLHVCRAPLIPVNRGSNSGLTAVGADWRGLSFLLIASCVAELEATASICATAVQPICRATSRHASSARNRWPQRAASRASAARVCTIRRRSAEASCRSATRIRSIIWCAA